MRRSRTADTAKEDAPFKDFTAQGARGGDDQCGEKEVYRKTGMAANTKLDASKGVTELGTPTAAWPRHLLELCGTRSQAGARALLGHRQIGRRRPRRHRYSSTRARWLWVLYRDTGRVARSNRTMRGHQGRHRFRFAFLRLCVLCAFVVKTRKSIVTWCCGRIPPFAAFPRSFRYYRLPPSTVYAAFNAFARTTGGGSIDARPRIA